MRLSDKTGNGLTSGMLVSKNKLTQDMCHPIRGQPLALCFGILRRGEASAIPHRRNYTDALVTLDIAETVSTDRINGHPFKAFPWTEVILRDPFTGNLNRDVFGC